MLRLFCSAAKLIPSVIHNAGHAVVPRTNFFAARTYSFMPCIKPVATPLLSNPKFTQMVNHVQSRGVIKFSRKRGTRKSVKPVRLRFYRLHWGGWIRRIAGWKKRMWKQSPSAKRRGQFHVLCNATQNYLLDKMAGKYWTKRRYYVDDPYEPYHSREENRSTARKPKDFEPPFGEVPNC